MVNLSRLSDLFFGHMKVQWSHRPPDPTSKIWLQLVQRGRGCACAKLAFRRLFFPCARLQTTLLERLTRLMAQAKRPEAGHIPYIFSIKIFKIYPFLCPKF